MVLLHVKKTEEQQFLYETTVEASVEDTLRELVELHNLRTRIHRLKLEGEELAKYGPAKQPDKQGIDTYAEEPLQKGDHYLMDPTGRRTGHACSPETAATLNRTLEEAEQTAHTKQAERKVALTKPLLEETINNIRGAVMIAYPMGLPEWDLVRQELEGTAELAGTSHANDELQLASASLWFAGKELLPGNKLRDHVGRHEKSKAVVKLQRKGQGAPGREPVVDEETRKAMMAFYYKKQEEQKKLEENADDDYLHSSWANPKALKQHFHGVSNVRLPR